MTLPSKSGLACMILTSYTLLQETNSSCALQLPDYSFTSQPLVQLSVLRVMWRTENKFQNMPGSTAFEIWLNDAYPTISTVIIIVVC